jgi:O-antigen/teichoic acid export membrane protein
LIAISSTNVGLSLLLIPSYGALGAAVGTIVSYMLGQLLYVTDQHRWLEVSPVVVLSLWASGLLAGLLQAGAGGSLPSRILSGLVATMVVVLVSRRVRSVNALFVTGLFHGRVRGVATVINHALVPRPSSAGAC